MTTQRKEINKEQFFTNFKTAERLSEFLKEQDWFEEVETIIEPSAGDGAWLDYLDVDLAYDIDPKHDDVIKVDDFLTYNVKKDIKKKGKVLYVGNPPFGRMGKLAKQFMDKCSKQGDYIAFILPASFAKVTQIRQLPKYFHLLYQEDLLDETFRFERDGKVVGTVFQVWEKRDVARKDPPRMDDCVDFEFVRNAEYTRVNASNDIIAEIQNKDIRLSSGAKAILKQTIESVIKENFKQQPAECPKGTDVVICTHGSGYGKVHTSNFKKLSTRTHRHIKIKSEISAKVLADRLRKLKPKFEDIAKYTVGADCISTEEILICYVEEYGNEETN
tara:strand:- start:47 stop:1039 length:993 start_codon:yes stop_codon:yes gene_type:complete